MKSIKDLITEKPRMYWKSEEEGYVKTSELEKSLALRKRTKKLEIPGKCDCSETSSAYHRNSSTCPTVLRSVQRDIDEIEKLRVKYPKGVTRDKIRQQEKKLCEMIRIFDGDKFMTAFDICFNVLCEGSEHDGTVSDIMLAELVKHNDSL